MRVMFVDDEPQILKGITRMLEGAEVDWEVETAASGADALKKLDLQQVDVMVSDMNMPGMDGADLLSEVSRLYPATVRVVLSGRADKEAMYRMVAPIHLYLSKPCKADVLCSAITNSCVLRSLLNARSSQESSKRAPIGPIFHAKHERGQS